MPTCHADHLIWIDLEMTGLDPLSDSIIEIATLVTDAAGQPAVVDADGAALRVRDLAGSPVRPPLAGHDGAIDAVAACKALPSRMMSPPLIMETPRAIVSLP